MPSDKVIFSPQIAMLTMSYCNNRYKGGRYQCIWSCTQKWHQGRSQSVNSSTRKSGVLLVVIFWRTIHLLGMHRVHYCCLMPLSTIFQLFRDSHVYWWMKQEYQQKQKTCGRSLINYRRKLYQVLFTMVRNHTHNFSSDRDWVHRLM